MRRYFLAALRAHLRWGRGLYALTAFGVALGVGSVLCIQILNLNALGAFSGSVQAVSGDADLSVLGRLPTFPERLYADVLAEPGVAAAWPLYRVDVSLASEPELLLEVVGFDFFAPVRMPVEGISREAGEVLSRRGWVAVTPSLAAERGWEVGDALEVTVGTRRARLTIGALVDFQRITPLASRKLAVMDIAQAQALLGTRGRIDQIDVQAVEGTDLVDLAARLEARLGPAVLRGGQDRGAPRSRRRGRGFRDQAPLDRDGSCGRGVDL